MTSFLLDSDLLIEHLRGRQQARSFIAELRASGDLLISAITVAELYTGAQIHKDEGQIDDLLRLTRILPVDEHLARQGGLLRGRYRQSHGTSLNDAIIAATAERERATLITFNKRHFPMVNDLIVPYERT